MPFLDRPLVEEPLSAVCARVAYRLVQIHWHRWPWPAGDVDEFVRQFDRSGRWCCSDVMLTTISAMFRLGAVERMGFKQARDRIILRARTAQLHRRRGHPWWRVR